MSQKRYALRTGSGIPELVAVDPIKQDAWIGSFAQKESLRTIIGVESAAARECDGRSPWPKIYFGEGRYSWPVLSPLYYLSPSSAPNVGISRQIDLIALKDITKGDVLTYDPATVCPHGDIAPLLDSEPRYFGCLSVARARALASVIPRPVMAEFSEQFTAPPMILVGLDRAETEEIRVALNTILAETGRSFDGDLSWIYPDPPTGAPLDCLGDWAARKEFLFSEWLGSPIVAAGGAVEALGLTNISGLGWYTHRGAQIARIPDPRTAEPAVAQKISEFFRVAPGDTGFVHQSTIGRVRVRPLPTTGFPRI